MCTQNKVKIITFGILKNILYFQGFYTIFSRPKYFVKISQQFQIYRTVAKTVQTVSIYFVSSTVNFLYYYGTHVTTNQQILPH